MIHYICTGGCKGVSETPGTCNAPTCPLHEHPLKECVCDDGLHEEVSNKAESDGQEIKTDEE